MQLQPHLVQIHLRTAGMAWLGSSWDIIWASCPSTASMDETGWCYEAFLPDVMGLIIPMLRSPNAFPFLLSFGGSNTERKELQENGFDSMSEGGGWGQTTCLGCLALGHLAGGPVATASRSQGECAAVGGHRPSGKHEIFSCLLSPWECRWLGACILIHLVAGRTGTPALSYQLLQWDGIVEYVKPSNWINSIFGCQRVRQAFKEWSFAEWDEGKKQQWQHKTQSHSASEQSLGGNIHHLGLMICNFSAIFPELSGSWQPWPNTALPGNYTI